MHNKLTVIKCPQRHLTYLLLHLGALCSTEHLAFSLPALVCSRALGARPGAEHRCLHTCCNLGLHLFKTPAQNEKNPTGDEAGKGTSCNASQMMDDSINENIAEGAETNTLYIICGVHLAHTRIRKGLKNAV